MFELDSFSGMAVVVCLDAFSFPFPSLGTTLLWWLDGLYLDKQPEAFDLYPCGDHYISNWFAPLF